MIISWGIPTIKATPYGTPVSGQSEGGTFPTPVEGTTQLSSEKGDKMEALVEGGEPEAVKYKRGKYTLEFQIRLGDGRVDAEGAVEESLDNDLALIDGTDGVVVGEWEVELTPEDAAQGAPGFKIPRAVCSYTDNYSSADGIIRTYTFDSLKVEGSAQILWTNKKSSV